MLELKINEKEIKDIQRKLNTMGPEQQAKTLSLGMRRAAMLLERDLKANISGRILSVRTGNLRNSVGSMVFVEGNDLAAKVGSGVRTGNRMKYANIHETGGVIRPVHGQFLAIPLPAAKTTGGDQRAISPRDFENTFVRGRVIYQKQGNKAVPLFALKKEVRIPARKYLSRTLQSARDKVIEELTFSAEKGLNS